MRSLRFVSPLVALLSAASSVRAAKPEAVPYEDGDETPAGYHLERRARTGPIGAGGVLFGVAYSIGLVTGIGSSSSSSKWMVVPLAGPFIAAAHRGRWDRFDDLDRGGLAWMNGVLQATGVIAVVCGVVFPRTWWVHDDAAVSWQMTPMLGNGTSGLAFTGAF